jgi:hypothetical protein
MCIYEDMNAPSERISNHCDLGMNHLHCMLVNSANTLANTYLCSVKGIQSSPLLKPFGDLKFYGFSLLKFKIGWVL